METVFRCANCGHVIRSPHARCPYCGHQRQEAQTGKEGYHVFLVAPGPDPTLTASVLSGKLGKSESEIHDIHRNLPAHILTTDSRHTAEHMVMLLEKAGAEAQITRSGEMEPETAEPETEIFDSMKPAKGKRFSWILPLIALIPVLLSLIPEILDKLPAFANRYVMEYSEEIFSDFEAVMIVVAARDLVPGTVITPEDLKVLTVLRENAPKNSVAPLHVDRLIGKVLHTPVGKDQVISLESMADNE